MIKDAFEQDENLYFTFGKQKMPEPQVVDYDAIGKKKLNLKRKLSFVSEKSDEYKRESGSDDSSPEKQEEFSDTASVAS